MKVLHYRTIAKTVFDFLKNGAELKFAFIQVTTRCNAQCKDRCNIWAQKPFDMPLQDVKFAIDALAKNGFSVVYFTGGETGLYPHLAGALKHAKSKGLITSLTSNGTISKSTLRQMVGFLDVLSVSVDSFDGQQWDQAKNLAGISVRAQETIRTAKALGMQVYAITFLNPAWSNRDVEQVVHFVNDDLGVSFALSYPYISSNESTFTVGGELRSAKMQMQRQVRNLVAKVLNMKLGGADVATVSCYLKDVLRTHSGQPMRFRCNAGKSIVTIDCNLDVYPCYRRRKLFNLKTHPDLRLPTADNSGCDNKDCLINCFKEASLASKQTALKAVAEEFFSNTHFYLKLLTRQS